MSAKDELHRLVDVLSEYECKYLLDSVQDIAEGERFWEGDFGLLYNDYVKLRYVNISRTPSPIPSVEDDAFVPIPIIKAYAGAQRLQLPASERLNASLTETLTRRRSRRDYNGTSLSLIQLSTLLRHASGVTGFVPGYRYTRLPLRSFPSHGGLQAPEIYLSVQAVDGLPDGIYHYHALDHVLESLTPGDHSQRLCTLTFHERFVETSAVVFLITGYYERLRWKYGERAYRFMCMDAGFLGENFYLVAEALGLGACAISAFAQDEVEELLGIDGKEEIALMLLAVGVRPDNEKVSAEVEHLQ
jgi:SagB-type dehydrogenase family enzyme